MSKNRRIIACFYARGAATRMAGMLNIAVILPAAGQSRRFGAKQGQSKLSVEIGRKAVLLRAVELFANRAEVKQVIVAGDPDDMTAFRFRWGEPLGILGVTIVPGGRVERWETVRNALAALGDEITHVAVHDAARPVTDPATIDRVFEAAKSHGAVIPAVPIHATIKRVEECVAAASDADPLDAILGGTGKTGVKAQRVIETVPRKGLWAVQTPQVFERKLLERAYAQVSSGKLNASQITDDAGLVEALGEAVVVVEGDAMNVKITLPQDVAFAEAVLAVRSGKPAGDALGPKRKHPTWAQSEED